MFDEHDSGGRELEGEAAPKEGVAAPQRGRRGDEHEPGRTGMTSSKHVAVA
jgi:hypothetical protein